jgi:hypothetical protein
MTMGILRMRALMLWLQSKASRRHPTRANSISPYAISRRPTNTCGVFRPWRGISRLLYLSRARESPRSAHQRAGQKAMHEKL